MSSQPDEDEEADKDGGEEAPFVAQMRTQAATFAQIFPNGDDYHPPAAGKNSRFIPQKPKATYHPLGNNSRFIPLPFIPPKPKATCVTTDGTNWPTADNPTPSSSGRHEPRKNPWMLVADHVEAINRRKRFAAMRR